MTAAVAAAGEVDSAARRSLQEFKLYKSRFNFSAVLQFRKVRIIDQLDRIWVDAAGADSGYKQLRTQQNIPGNGTGLDIYRMLADPGAHQKIYAKAIVDLRQQLIERQVDHLVENDRLANITGVAIAPVRHDRLAVLDRVREIREIFVKLDRLCDRHSDPHIS